jgi:hypothetical protein
MRRRLWSEKVARYVRAISLTIEWDLLKFYVARHVTRAIKYVLGAALHSASMLHLPYTLIVL